MTRGATGGRDQPVPRPSASTVTTTAPIAAPINPDRTYESESQTA